VIELDPNLTNPMFLTPTLNITLNATLFQPTQPTYIEWLKDWSPVLVGIAQVAVAAILAWLTYKLSDSTSKYSDQVEIQTAIMTRNIGLSERTLETEENMRRREALVKETDELIGPLCSKIGRFRTLEPFFLDYKTEDESRIFWEKIRRNLYLAPIGLRTLIDNYLKIMSEEGAKYKKAHQHISRAIMERYSELSKSRKIPEGEEEYRFIQQFLLPMLQDDKLIEPVPLADRENTDWIKVWGEIQQSKTIQGTDLIDAINEYFNAINGQKKADNPRISLEEAIKIRFEDNSNQFHSFEQI
jgi:hypothetical protein